MRRIVICAALALCACATEQETVFRDRMVEVKVPVAQPCVNGKRPEPVIPLKQTFSDEQWRALDTRQKAAVVGKQGLAHKTAGEDLNAATAGCP